MYGTYIKSFLNTFQLKNISSIKYNYFIKVKKSYIYIQIPLKLSCSNLQNYLKSFKSFSIALLSTSYRLQYNTNALSI